MSDAQSVFLSDVPSAVADSCTAVVIVIAVVVVA